MGIFSKIKNVFKKKQSEPEISNPEISNPVLVKCVDLSHHNEKVSLVRLLDMDLVILKATEGKSLVDKRFYERWIGLKSLGIKRGAYHFYRTNIDPIVQANHFIKTCEDLKPGDILAIDYETCDIKKIGIQTINDLKSHKQDAIKFMSHVEMITGIKPWFYTYHFVIEDCDFEPEFAKYPLWYARYTSVKPNDKQGPWSSMVAWQYSSKGKIDGISGDVDMNILK